MLYPKFCQEAFWNLGRSARYFLRRSAIMPPLGLLSVASELPGDFQVRLIDRNISEESDADWEWADVVFLSLMLAQREDYRVCVSNARIHRKPIAVGGPFTHAMPEVATADADWVCFGEAETIMEELVSNLRADRRGKQYQGGNSTNMESVKIPRSEILRDVNDYAHMAIQFSRGCPFACEFCDIIEIYGRVPRTKAPAQILAELTNLRKLGFHGYVYLVDDNFIANKKKAKAMLKELCVWNRDNGYPFRFHTEASINLADDDEMLELMSEANFINVFIGIETPDPELLRTTQKKQNIHGDMLEQLRRVRDMEFSHRGIIIGFDGERRGVFEMQRSFIQASGVGTAMMGLLQALPQTQLSRRLKAEGRLLEELSVSLVSTVEGLNFVPKGEMTKREYLARYRELVTQVYEPKAFFERILPALLTLRIKVPLRALFEVSRCYSPLAVPRLIYQLGVKAKSVRLQFWKAALQLLWKNPLALEAFVWECYCFHHLSRHVDYVQREMARYLSSPSPDDVLDEVVAADGNRAA